MVHILYSLQGTSDFRLLNQENMQDNRGSTIIPKPTAVPSTKKPGNKQIPKKDVLSAKKRSSAKKQPPKSKPAEQKDGGSENPVEVESKESHTKVQFSTEMDLELLREVYSSRPFAGTYKEISGNWEAVKAAMGIGWSSVSVLSIRRRFGLLQRKFKADESNSRQRLAKIYLEWWHISSILLTLINTFSSGQDEEYDEAYHLLTDITELMESHNWLVEKKHLDKENQAEAVRAAALEGLTGKLGWMLN